MKQLEDDISGISIKNKSSKKSSMSRSQKVKQDKVKKQSKPNKQETKNKSKKSTPKVKQNSFFKLMLEAKKNKKPFFMYNGQKYVGVPHDNLGMVYRKD